MQVLLRFWGGGGGCQFGFGGFGFEILRELRLRFLVFLIVT